MRRSDREVTDLNELVEIVEKCDVCRVALFDKEKDFPYIIPMNFGYEFEENKLILYFHGAKVGRKYEIMEKHNKVSFEMDCAHKLVTGEMACNYSMEFESIIGTGIIEIINEIDEKTFALEKIMLKYEKNRKFEKLDKAAMALRIFKITVNEFTGKRLKK